MATMYDYTCKQCNSPFQSRRRPGTTHEPKFCSKECADNSRRKHHPIECKFCGETFTPYTSHMEYCSKDCFNAQRHEDAKIECEVCGKVFVPDRLAVKYCSQACYGQTMLSKYPREGKEFSRAVRRAIRNRDNHQCVKCGSTHKLEVDHVHPSALGGTNSIDNGQLLCWSCHQEKTIEDRRRIRDANGSE